MAWLTDAHLDVKHDPLQQLRPVVILANLLTSECVLLQLILVVLL